jgi:hypothetical protein
MHIPHVEKLSGNRQKLHESFNATLLSFSCRLIESQFMAIGTGPAQPLLQPSLARKHVSRYFTGPDPTYPLFLTRWPKIAVNLDDHDAVIAALQDVDIVM